MPETASTAALLIGGRCGVGKATVGLEVSARLQAAEVAHALVNGNYLDHVHPAPRAIRRGRRSPRRTSLRSGATTRRSAAAG
jgi:adenylylsulfate kinase-like enzyme